jgi:hypothetical protein
LDEASIIDMLKKENTRLKSEKELMSETTSEFHVQKEKLNEKVITICHHLQ